MFRLNIQMFGGRGASSSKKNTGVSQSALDNYFKNNTRDYSNVAVTMGNNHLITDGYSIVKLDGKKSGDVKNYDESLKRMYDDFNDNFEVEQRIKVKDLQWEETHDRFKIKNAKINDKYGIDKREYNKIKRFIKTDEFYVKTKGDNVVYYFKDKKTKKDAYLLPTRVY